MGQNGHDHVLGMRKSRNLMTVGKKSAPHHAARSWRSLYAPRPLLEPNLRGETPGEKDSRGRSPNVSQRPIALARDGCPRVSPRICPDVSTTEKTERASAHSRTARGKSPDFQGSHGD